MVPVLPATGRPIDAPRPVRPRVSPSTTPVSTELTVSATGCSRTCLHACAGSSIGAPLLSRIAVTGRGGQYRPRAAKVAYAPAMASGLMSAAPRTKDALRSSGAEGRPSLNAWTPMSSARAAGPSMPVRSSSWMK